MRADDDTPVYQARATTSADGLRAIEKVGLFYLLLRAPPPGRKRRVDAPARGHISEK